MKLARFAVDEGLIFINPSLVTAVVEQHEKLCTVRFGANNSIRIPLPAQLVAEDLEKVSREP